MQLFTNPVTVVALTALAYFAITKAIAAIEQARTESATRNKANIDTVARLAMSQEALAKQISEAITVVSIEFGNLRIVLSDIRTAVSEASAARDKIMEGTTKACEAIAVATDKHRETVAQFTKLVVGPGIDKDALEQPSDEHKDRIFAEMAHRAAGETPDRARELAELEEMQGSNSYPTV